MSHSVNPSRPTERREVTRFVNRLTIHSTGCRLHEGSRYLLRNGLDYLNYKEYERALRFLREAECRKAELNNAEKLVLKKGIETAQRGLRQAADAESPYALSERSRNRNGFSPAKPETVIAGQARPFLRCQTIGQGQPIVW